MLKPTADCQRFRDAFEPDSSIGEDHRANCTACDAWADRRSTAVARTVVPADRPRSMPASLAARLRAIPAQEVVCRDVDRLMAAARAQARGEAPEPAAVEHTSRCPRCAATYGALTTAMAVARARRLPLGLEKTLHQIARHRTILPFVPKVFRDFDVRWAVAATLLVGLLMQPFTANVAAAGRSLRVQAEANIAGWVVGNEAEGWGWWQAVETSSVQAGQTVRTRVATHGAIWKKLYQRTRLVARDEASTIMATFASLRGDDHE